jgi:hypothetical protein
MDKDLIKLLLGALAALGLAGLARGLLGRRPGAKPDPAAGAAAAAAVGDAERRAAAATAARLAAEAAAARDRGQNELAAYRASLSPNERLRRALARAREYRQRKPGAGSGGR